MKSVVKSVELKTELEDTGVMNDEPDDDVDEDDEDDAREIDWQFRNRMLIVK